MWPSTFPSGQGSNLAGVVEAVGPGVTEEAVRAIAGAAEEAAPG